MDRLKNDVLAIFSRVANYQAAGGASSVIALTPAEFATLRQAIFTRQSLSQEAVRNEALEALEEGYAVLAHVTNQWEGRHTIEGQKLLCKMRDAIASATGISGEFVQDNATNPLKREPNAEEK